MAIDSMLPHRQRVFLSRGVELVEQCDGEGFGRLSLHYGPDSEAREEFWYSSFGERADALAEALEASADALRRQRALEAHVRHVAKHGH